MAERLLHPDIPHLIKIADLTAISGFDEPVIRELAKNGDLTMVRVGRIERVVLQSYEALMTRVGAGEWASPFQALGFIYFILDDKRRMKIGYSVDPHKRLKSMQTGSGARLHLIATIPGCLADEHDMHERFARYRIHREWFKFTGKLRVFVERLADG